MTKLTHTLYLCSNFSTGSKVQQTSGEEGMKRTHPFCTNDLKKKKKKEPATVFLQVIMQKNAECLEGVFVM